MQLHEIWQFHSSKSVKRLNITNSFITKKASWVKLHSTGEVMPHFSNSRTEKNFLLYPPKSIIKLSAKWQQMGANRVWTRIATRQLDCENPADVVQGVKKAHHRTAWVFWNPTVTRWRGSEGANSSRCKAHSVGNTWQPPSRLMGFVARELDRPTSPFPLLIWP